MTHTLTNQINHLEELLKTAKNPKILWEEMQILGNQAFDLQDKIMLALDKAEETEVDISAVQQLFETREYVWDLMNQIALLEAHLKEKTFSNDKGEKKISCSCHGQKEEEKHSCCCSHGHKDKTCCSRKTGRKKCSCQNKKSAEKKCAPKKKIKKG